MSKLLICENGKKIAINLAADLRLYEAPVNPPNTGTAYTAGVDLYAHKTRSGNWFYYEYSWSMWQGVEERYSLISREDAISFLLDKASLSGHAELYGRDLNVCMEHFGSEIFEENA